MNMKIIMGAAGLLALTATNAFALCQSNINGGTTMNEGDCYMHSAGVAVGCHGGVLNPVGGTTNKCKAWIKVERLPNTNQSGKTADPIKAGKGSALSSSIGVDGKPIQKKVVKN